MFSNVTLQSFAGNNTNYLIPEVVSQEANISIFKDWELTGYSQRLPLGAFAAGPRGGILHITDTEVNDLETSEFFNLEQIFNNNNLPKKWFRDGDSDIESGDINFDCFSEHGGSEFYSAGGGKYIVLRIRY